MILLIGLASAMTPEEAVRAAMEKSPALAAAEADVEMARGAVAGASGIRQNPRADARLGEERLELELSLPLSVSGEGLAAAMSARAQQEAAERALGWAKLETAAEARRAWAEAAGAATSVEIAEEELAAATQMRAIATQRAAAGEGTAFEVHLSRLEEARAAGALLEVRAEAAERRMALATLTGDPEATAEGDPLSAAPLGVASVAAEGGRADVRAAESRTAAARSAVSRVRAAILPPVEVGVFYEDDGGHASVGPTVGVEVPLWSWNAAGRGETRGELLRAEADLASTTARATLEARTGMERQQEAEATLALLGEDPDADVGAVLAGIEVALRAGEMDLADATLL